MLSEIYPELLWLLFMFLGGGVIVHFKDYRKKIPKDTPKKSINISEPVLSFVEEVKNSPKSFGLYKSVSNGHYLLVDKNNSVSYGFKQGMLYHPFLMRDVPQSFIETLPVFESENYKIKVEQVSWLTEDEEKYLYKELYEPSIKREERYKEVLHLRKEKNHRRKLRKLYQKEKQ